MATPIPFNASWYLAQNPDVAQAVNAGLTDAQTHFDTYGKAEARSGSPLFNPQNYMAENPDVAAAVQSGLITAQDHFELFGGGEGRSPTPVFDESFYLQQNPDVAQAIADGTVQSGAQHFVLFGYQEARAINPAIDLGNYLVANPDVSQATSSGLISVFDHLMQFGINEPRNLGNGVSLADFANDPPFRQALSTANVDDALARVLAVAPFIPTFQRPAGWTPDPNTPIPVDFVPPTGSGLKLVVPPDIVVPDGTVLPPDVFEPVNPPPDDTGPTFTVIESGSAPVKTIAFQGSATGPITLTTDGEHLIFTRSGIEATTKPILADVAAGGISADPGVTMTAATFATGEVAAKLAEASATLGDVTTDVAYVVSHIEKVKADGITAISLSDDQAADILSSNAIAAGAVTIAEAVAASKDAVLNNIGKIADNSITGITLTDDEFANASSDTLNGVLTDDALTVNASGVGDGSIIDASGYTKALKLNGGAWADTITGGSGNDVITGGANADVLAGGIGADVLTGGLGADHFVYTAVGDSAPSLLADTIRTFDSLTDFRGNLLGDDKIDISAINATLTGGIAASGITVTSVADLIREIDSVRELIHHFKDLVDRIREGGGLLTASAEGGAGAATGLQAYILDLADNVGGGLGTSKYLLINNNNTYLDEHDVMIELTGVSEADDLSSHFILSPV